MKVKRFDDAAPYEAPNHFGVRGLRLQGFEAGGPEKFWVGLSHYLPGATAGPDASPLEKVYVVIAGNLTVRCGATTVVLGPMDSCTIGVNEEREIRNEGNAVATLLVVMPYPEQPA